MAETPEGKIKAMVKRRLQEFSPLHFHFLPVSAGYGKHGIPDIIGCVFGIFVGIETKVPGKEPTALQEERLREIAKADGVAAVVHDRREMERVIDAICKHHATGVSCGHIVNFDCSK